MNDFVSVIKKDPKVQAKIKDTSDTYKRLPYNYQSKIGYVSLIQNVILKESINIMGTTITDLDIELKMKNRRKKYFESKKLI